MEAQFGRLGIDVGSQYDRAANAAVCNINFVFGLQHLLALDIQLRTNVDEVGIGQIPNIFLYRRAGYPIKLFAHCFNIDDTGGVITQIDETFSSSSMLRISGREVGHV